MESFNNIYLFFFFLIVGAVVVGIDANSLYRTQKPIAQIERIYPLLETVSLTHVSGPAFLTGFLCYLGISEFLFLVLATSFEILELTAFSSGLSNTVGARLSDESAGFNPYVPLIASTVLTSAARVKPFDQVERHIRNISHRIAGIPDHLLDNLDKVNRYSFEPQSEDDTGPILNAALDIANEAQKYCLKCGADETFANQLQELLTKIYFLHEMSNGIESGQIWSQENSNALKTTSDAVTQRFENFDMKLKSLLVEVSGKKRKSELAVYSDEWIKVVDGAKDVFDGIALLFVLLLMNERKLKPYYSSKALNSLISHVKGRSKSVELNALHGSVLIGSAIVALINISYYIVSGHVSAKSKSIGDEISGMGRVAAYWKDFKFTSANVSVDIGKGFWETADTFILFGLSAFAALHMRAIGRLSDHISYYRSKISYKSYMACSVNSAAITILFFLLVKFLYLVVMPAMFETDSGNWLDNNLITTSLLQDFSDNVPYLIALALLISGFTSWLVYRISEMQATYGRTDVLLMALWAGSGAALIYFILKTYHGQINTNIDILEAIGLPLIGYATYIFVYGSLCTGTSWLPKKA